MARDRSAPGNPPTFWEELAEAMSSEPNNEVVLERLRAIPAVARNILQTEDSGPAFRAETDSEESSDGIDSNPSVDDSHLPNHRIPSQSDRAQRQAVMNEIALAYDGSQRSYSTTVFSNDRIQLDPRQVTPCARQG